MAVEQHSTITPARPLLREALPSGGLLPGRRAELLAILEDAPTARSWGFLTRPQREAIQTGVDALIDFLDAVDADPDLKDGADDELTGDDEESLGWSANVSQTHLGRNTADGDNTAPERHGCGFVNCSPDDVEITCEDEGADILSQPHDEEDGEPSLGSPEIHHDQRRWGQGSGSRVGDHDDTDAVDLTHEQRQACDDARRRTEALLRRHRLIRPPSDVLRDRGGNVVLFRGMWPLHV